MTKKKLLVTIGDSWTYGIGNLHPELFKENMTIDERSEFHSNPLQSQYELDNAWGSWVSDNLGFDEWLNFSQPARSFESMWKLFLETNPRDTFVDYDVHIIIMSSYFSRLTLATSINDWGSFDTSSDIYDVYIKHLVEHGYENDIDEILNNNSARVLKNAMFYLNYLGFKFVFGFNKIDDEIYFRKKYPKLSKNDKILKPPFDMGFFHGNNIREDWQVSYDGHLNEDAYKFIGLYISSCIKSMNISWDSAPKKSKKWKRVYKTNEIGHPLINIKPDSGLTL